MCVICSSILCFHFAYKNTYAARARRMLGESKKKKHEELLKFQHTSNLFSFLLQNG